MADFRSLLSATGYGPLGGAQIYFPAVDVTTQSGHEAAKHTALRVRGADIEPTGQKPYTVKMRIALLEDLEQAGGGTWDDGPWQDVYRRLVECFEANPIGTLSHPLRGPMTVLVEDWDDKIDAGIRDGVFLDVTFVEHNADSGLDGLSRTRAADDPPTRATAQAASADAAAAGLSVAPTPMVPRIGAMLDALDAAEGYGATAGLVDAELAAARANLALPGVAESYRYRLATELLVAALYDVRTYYLGTREPGVYVVRAPMSLARIAALPEVYGDPGLATLLRQANRVSDPVLVPVSTRLVVPPVAS